MMLFRLRTVLRECLHIDDVSELEPLPGGVFSRAFAFRAGGQAYVARLSAYGHAAEAFAKDDYAVRHFSSPALPIPRVVARASTPIGHIAVSERAVGRTLDQMSPAERQRLLPAMLDTFDAIGRADVSASQGYGSWNAQGIGEADSWHAYLAAASENAMTGFYANWHALFRDSFLERDAYETIYQGMRRLLRYCPEDRALIHNDAHFENVLGEGERITAVIDWGNALYGDALHEIAQLAWWSAWPGWWYDDVAGQLDARYGAAPHYAERIACYQLHLGLDDLRYYAKSGKRAEYEMSRDRLVALVGRMRTVE